MTILEEAEKVQTDARQYLDSLGEKFLQENKGKTVVVFPYLKEYIVVDDPVKVNDMVKGEKYQKEVSYIFNI